MKLEIDLFLNAVKRNFYFTDQEIESLANAFSEMYRSGLIGNDFLPKLGGGKDQSCQALSELQLFRFFQEHGFKPQKIGSQKKGVPDFLVKLNNVEIVVELITPMRVDTENASFSHFESTTENGRPVFKRKGSIDVVQLKKDSLFEVISSCIHTKMKQFRKYLSDDVKVIDESHVNIICINLGFIDGVDEVDFHFFNSLYGLIATHIEIEVDMDGQSFVSSKQNIKYDHTFIKNNGTCVNGSVFSEGLDDAIINDYTIISGIWFICLNEAGELTQNKLLKNPHAKNPMPEIFENASSASRNYPSANNV
ncbi:hypothetical protein EIC82_03855 [Enterobacter sp. A11]|uniref:hypothetical protein n=1 Tax=unclassified Enterobacter TaxID=2608935 RepID=UPI00106F7C93|nr:MULTISPECIES: hypothetical protein [unclassified Enterobacter]MBM1020218.1 hypothetical protein [Enterobacter sp. E1]MEA3561519.1 hypothetical protein [Enterobacter sp. GM-22]MEA3595185.1 hypothetical protein [Enterobacter sp. GM-31]TFF60322.1 hypothetical protein EIC82_03855 [Enterobacter sp. A11]